MPSSHRTIRMIAMVSNISVLQFPNPLLRLATQRCNRCAALGRTAVGVLTLFLLAIFPIRAAAQSNATGDTLQLPPADEHRVVDTVKFLTGAALGLGLHEGGHLTFDAAFDAGPR